ncbi:hypothetical protein KIW84_062735 [Lathyrus oleraceus]|uniref:RRM domain-containing protein n=1 Tax=Pisum sativum TaxID=3888 RepID=A0A9D5A6S5_PEA|nr:hypothetical protein KIW84_062735 [Pisum sativum]
MKDDNTSVENGKTEDGVEALENPVTSESADEVSAFPLEHCMRILPHDQNTGAFFIAVLQNISPLPADVNVASSLSTDNDIFDILPQAKKRKYFMKNLYKTFDSRALHDTFSTVGHILFCEMATVGSGHSKGFSFAQLENAEPAKTAIDKLNRLLINDKR